MSDLILTRLLTVAALLLASPLVLGQTHTYCCTDASGRRACGDTLPQVCYERAYREVTPGGRVVREVEAPLTSEQRTKRDAELKVQRDKAIKEAEAKRRDRVLLDSYATVTEIDARRDRELASITADLKRAKTQEADLLQVRAKLEKLKPATGAIPRDVVEDLMTNTSELAAARSIIDSKQRDIDATRARFETDRNRFLELSQVPANPR
ncbi:hypothetical protein VVD49_03220 [Uliginosibacterium sp. H3]|uniref:DUF4124 domain-containing protein n=1 Tax=Uliginosibacterium silvisoli TaxID=3114758 RepID=A0ABU6JZS8_9RHOO|nr:hypothetical protein [Uliginosibacterium sp. H3]